MFLKTQGDLWSIVNSTVKFEFPIACYIWYFTKYSVVVVVVLFVLVKTGTQRLHIKCTVKSKESHSASLSEFLDEFAVFI